MDRASWMRVCFFWLQLFQFGHRLVDGLFGQIHCGHLGQLGQSEGVRGPDHGVAQKGAEAALKDRSAFGVGQQLAHGDGVLFQIQGIHLHAQSMRRGPVLDFLCRTAYTL